MFRTKKDVERHVTDVLSKINSENEKNLRGYTFARLFFQVKDYETAKKHLSGFLGIRDHHAPGHKLMAQIYEATNNSENALQSYKRSLEIDSHQSDIVLKICELYCQLSVDHETARYWADRAELLYPHNEIVFKLRECMVSAEGEPNHKELETLIATELESQPKNITLRIRLLRLYLDTERVKEAYDHATMIESKRLFPHSVEWYYLLGDVFEAFQEEFGPNLDTDFYINYMSALDRLILLTLAEPHAFACENGKKHYSVNDAAAVLLTFDQVLKKACDKKITSSSWTYFLHHMKGQLYYNMATLLLKRAKMDQGNRKEAMRFSAGLALVCYSFKPVNLLQEIWFSQLEDSQKAFTNYFQQGCLRTSFIGHMITDMCREEKSKWLQKLKLDICINQVKERIYARALSSVVEKDKLLTSYFIKDSTFENSSLEFPSEAALQEYDKAAYKLCPDSLHHLVWLELHRKATEPKFHDNISKVFEGLQHSNKSLSKGSCESLCILDIEAFLYASVYQTRSAMEKKKSFPSSKFVDSQLSLPPDIADPMCSKQQAAWWKAAYGLHACTIKDKLGEARRDLSRGLEVIRGIGNHGMEVQLIVHLARVFADKADSLLKEQNGSDNKNKKIKPDNVSALQHLSIHYWKLALNILGKMSSGESQRIPKEQMFVGFSKVLSAAEVKSLQEDGQLYIAVNLMDSEKLDAAAEILSKLDTPYGSYYLALTLRKLAFLEERYSNTKSILLTKAKNSIHDTMDRIKDDKTHPLNKEIYLVLEDIESELGTYHSMNDSPNESDEVDAFGTPELNNSIYTTPSSHKTVMHSTPRPSVQFIPTKSKAVTSNSTSRKHFEPSPERLDAQMRALSLNQDTIVKTLMDQQKSLMETNITIANSLKQNNEVLEHLKKLLEDLKVSGIRGQARGGSRKPSYSKAQADEEDYADYDPSNQLEYYPEENTEDYPNRAYAYNASSRLVHDAVAAPLNYVLPPPGPPPINHYNYQYPPHGVLPPVDQRTPYYHQPPGQGLPFSEGQQLPQFQFHVANPVVKHPPQVMPSIPQMPPPPTVNMQPPNVPMSIASPWGKTGSHAFQISLPQSNILASPSSQSELKEMLKMPPPPIANSPFGQGLAPLPMTPTTTPSIFAGISKTPETNKLERSRCNSENTASPDIDGDLEREVMGDFKPLIPLPAEVVVETGEENELVLFEDRAKLYRFVDQEWKERGTGIVKILHHNASGRVRLLMRRDQVLKVCANHYMSSDMEISPLKSSDRAWTWVAQDFADEVLRPEHFCIRFKTAELATSFKAAFNKAINIVKETESKKVTSPKVSVAESAPVAQKGFGSQFVPKAGSWSCPTCYVSNTADKLSCVACATKKIPIVSNANHVSTTVSSAATVQSPIVSFKATTGINQFQFKSPVSTQSGGFTFGSTTLSSDSATQNKFGGFTFSSSPTITETPEPSIKDREILIVSTKDTKSPQVSKIDQPTSSPFSGFSFSKPSFQSDLSIQVSDTSRSVTVTSEKPTSFSELSSKPFATTMTPTFSGNASSLSKMQSMIQNVKPAFSLDPNSSPKTPDTSIVNASQKVSTNESFGTTTAPQTILNNNRLSTDGSPEEFIPTAEFKPVVPLPALVDIKTGEEEDELVFEERAKLFRYDPTTKEWKERGTGVLKILYLKHSHKYRILMRRDQVHKICANHYILPEMKLEAKGEKSWVWFSQDYSEEELEQQQFAVRFKTVDIAKKFQTVFLDCQAKLKETKPKDTVTGDKCKGNSVAFEKLVGESKMYVSEKVTEPQKEKPLSELFKPDAGSWECNACYVRNKSGDSKCLSCESPNPSSTAAQQTTPASMPLFSSASKTTGGFGDLFKPKEGTWECKSCYVRNSADKAKCVSCDTENATSSATKPASSVFGTSESNAFGAFKFGSSDTPKSTFTFGTPKSGSGFVFGTKPESQLATFTFGQSTVSTNANETTNNNNALIFDGVSQNVLAEKGNASEQTIFGSATNFSFADLAKSQADSGEFTFGSPQKYEFSFDGVRPQSPSKAPKSPRSPAAPSDADEEDEVEDSEADNLYFEPVIPLPPKVEVKTGEEEEKVLFCKRAKLFRFSNSEWKERGLGDIKILLDEKSNRVRLLMRREQVLKVCLNHHLTKDMKFEWRNDKSLSWTATDFSENEPSPELLAVKFKTTEYAEEFKKAIDDALEVSSQPQSPKSENISLKPASTFSFKTNDPVKVEPQGFSFGSLSSRFGGSPQQSQTVFGSAATGFSFKDSTAGSGTSQISFSLKDNSSTSSFFTKPSVFGGFGVAPLESKEDQDIEVVYEPIVPEEKVKLAEKLLLPKSFFLYENKPSCQGCIGCEDKIPPFKTSEYQESVKKASTPDTNATSKSSAVTKESSMPFSSSSFSTFSFSDIASSTDFEKLAKSPASEKTVFAGAGTPLFQKLNTSADEGAAQQNTPSTTPFFPAASKTTGRFGDLFKPKKGMWECKSCCVRYSADETKSVFCDTENALHTLPSLSFHVIHLKQEANLSLPQSLKVSQQLPLDSQQFLAKPMKPQ
ncbi:hypothetical protein JTE90_011312 [Oedothorax gibbosus]|uniref:E3 SUMO-protein ligase RanBP2 n=1 Tax=Oedothorax gibbosus TaxID=931172 RepID=A0AAV6VLW2_9ARAC|nr:hypothetical protein JTE90_011312 [Oedothorax gibbosus]